jgi:hypothetical protein
MTTEGADKELAMIRRVSNGIYEAWLYKSKDESKVVGYGLENTKELLQNKVNTMHQQPIATDEYAALEALKTEGDDVMIFYIRRTTAHGRPGSFGVDVPSMLGSRKWIPPHSRALKGPTDLRPFWLGSLEDDAIDEVIGALEDMHYAAIENVVSENRGKGWLIKSDIYQGYMNNIAKYINTSSKTTISNQAIMSKVIDK